MDEATIWDARRGRIVTRKGGWRIGEGVRVGPHSLFDEIIGTYGFFDLVFLQVTDRLPPPGFVRWMEGMLMCGSFPDPRIWCNQVGALAGTMRCTPVAAVTAGTLASDSFLYGPGVARIALEFIAAAVREARAGATAEQIVARRSKPDGSVRLPGYSRPVAEGDDRVDVLRRLAAQLDLHEGEHTAIAWQIDAYLRAHGKDSINAVGYGAAFVQDQGVSVEETYRLFSLGVSGGVHGCYSEAADEPAGTFLPLRVDDVEYTGAPARALPGSADA